ncbi:hypothetical protein D3C84_1178430 [compost metagenome]
METERDLELGHFAKAVQAQFLFAVDLHIGCPLLQMSGQVGGEQVWRFDDMCIAAEYEWAHGSSPVKGFVGVPMAADSDSQC